MGGGDLGCSSPPAFPLEPMLLRPHTSRKLAHSGKRIDYFPTPFRSGSTPSRRVARGSPQRLCASASSPVKWAQGPPAQDFHEKQTKQHLGGAQQSVEV